MLDKLPIEIVRQIYALDSSYRTNYKLVILSLKRLPTFERVIDQTQVEFTYRLKNFRYRRAHVYCSYSCYLRSVVFFAMNKNRIKRAVYFGNRNKTILPHDYICEDWKNNSNPINIFTTTKYELL
jgi:hypothetical protein